MDDDLDIADLMNRIQAGDQDAAATLVKKYEPLIRRMVRVRLTDPNLNRLFESMDVCQSVLQSFFVRAAVGEYDVQDANQLVNLLITMARNKLASRARREYRQKRDSRRFAEADSQGGDFVDRDQQTPSMAVEGKELVEQAKSLLRDDERQMAEMRGAGLSWEEIAGQLGGTAQARRVQFSRAMERVSERLGLNSL